MSERGYILGLVGSLLGLSLLVLAVNAFIDPYGLIGSPRVVGINERKADINDYSRLMKRYQPHEQAHSALILGNSRAEMGLDPAHSCFAASGMHVYNLATPGGELREQLQAALDVIYQQPIDTVFLPLEFIDFISLYPARRDVDLFVSGDAALRYLPDGSANPEFAWQRFLGYYRALFSLDALISSVVTVAGQSPLSADRYSNGFNPADDFEMLIQREGARALFDQKMAEVRQKYARPWQLYGAGGQLSQAFDDLADFVEFAARRRIDVVLLTQPIHAEYWDYMAERGFDVMYDDWFARMRELVADSNANARAGHQVALWDFARDPRYINEPVPAGVSREPLQWFWEPVHYRSELGDLMIEAMLADRCGSEVRIGRRVN